MGSSFIKIRFDLAEIEAFLDNLDYPMSYSSHFTVANHDDTRWDNRLITQELKFKVSFLIWQRKGHFLINWTIPCLIVAI